MVAHLCQRNFLLMKFISLTAQSLFFLCHGEVVYWHILGTEFSFNSTNVLSEVLADVMRVYFLQVTHLLATIYSLTRERSSRALTQEHAIFNTYIKHCFLLLGHHWHFGYPLACPEWEATVRSPHAELNQATDLWALHPQILQGPDLNLFGRELGPTGQIQAPRCLRVLTLPGSWTWRNTLAAEARRAESLGSDRSFTSQPWGGLSACPATCDPSLPWQGRHTGCLQGVWEWDCGAQPWRGWPRTTSLTKPLAAGTAGAWAAQAETCEGAAWRASFSAD